MIESLSQIEKKSELAEAFRYSLNRWDALPLYRGWSIGDRQGDDFILHLIGGFEWGRYFDRTLSV
jgi:hypothetical protein